MRIRRRLGATLVAVTIATASLITAVPAGADGFPRIRWTGCPIDLPTDRVVDCGELLVRESRSDPNSRIIRVAFAIVRAPGTPRPDPVVLVMGGPSFPAIDPFSTEFYFDDAPYTEDRDLILVDLRGTRSSTPFLSCHEFDRLDADTWPEGPNNAQIDAAIAGCRDRLSMVANLRRYGSVATAKDLRDIRLELGIDQWNVIAFSAGGEVGFPLLEEDPEGIRAVIFDAPLTGPTQPSQTAWWLVEAPRRLINHMFTGCEAQPDCAEAFPDLEARFMRRVEALRRHPRTLELPVVGGGTLEVTIDGDGLLLDVSYLMGFVPATPYGPAIVSDILRFGIDSFYTDPVGPPFPRADVLAEGRTASYRCREFWSTMTPGSVDAAAARFPFWANIIRGEVAGWRHECGIWHVGVDPSVRGFVDSDLPALVFSGEWDGAVPNAPIFAAARHLTNSTLVQVPGIDHGALVSWGGWADCPRSIADAFLDDPGAALDTSCVDDMPRIEFFVPEPGTSVATIPSWPERDRWNFFLRAGTSTFD